MSRDIKVGDWVVIYEYRYRAAGPVSAATAKTYTAPSTWGGEIRKPVGNALFAGTQEAAQKLANQLQSSRAMAEEDGRKAMKRHNERAINYVEKAAADRDELAREGSASGMNPKGGPA